MAPGAPEDFDALFKADVGAVLIFKNATTGGHDVDDEIATLRERGLPAGQVAHIPFKWKDIGPFKEPCAQVVDALKFIDTNLAAGKKTLFHCTVGEDRTGFLAAMPLMLNLTTDYGDLDLTFEPAGPREGFSDWDRDAQDVEIAPGLVVRIATLDAVIDSKRELLCLRPSTSWRSVVRSRPMTST